MRIAVDVDSTLARSWELLCDAARSLFDVTLDYAEQTEWTGRPLTEAEFQACVAESHTEQSVLRARPYPEATAQIARWRAAGHEVYILSHRPSDTEDATARWLERIGCSHDGLWCAPNKVARCLELDVGLLIDDAPANVEGAVAHGILVAMLRHPWNSGCWELPGVTAGADWRELGSRLARVLARAD